MTKRFFYDADVLGNVVGLAFNCCLDLEIDVDGSPSSFSGIIINLFAFQVTIGYINNKL